VLGGDPLKRNDVDALDLLGHSSPRTESSGGARAALPR
jgi:hypothetical protein